MSIIDYSRVTFESNGEKVYPTAKANDTWLSTLEDVETVVLDSRNRIESIVAGSTPEGTEVVDARIDEMDGITYGTLKERLKYLTYYNQRTVDSIAELKKTKFALGTIVLVKSYYGDNFCPHWRIITNQESAITEKLDNGRYAELLYDDKINVEWLGARNSYNTENKIYDTTPYLKIIANLGSSAFIPPGWWACSYYQFRTQNSFKIIGCNEQPYFNGENYTPNITSSVLFPYNIGQDSVLHIGRNTGEVRGVLVRNIQFITNCMEYNENGKFVPTTSGAKCGLNLETVVFSKVRDLIITGTNLNAEYGIRFNGCETYFDMIMFRRFGLMGSNVKCAFHTYNRYANTDTGATAMSVSGLRYTNIAFEGVGCNHMNLCGVDVHVQGVNVEFGYIRTTDGYSTYNNMEQDFDSVVDFEADANYEPMGIFTVGGDTNGIIISDVTAQKMGTILYNGTTYKAFDSIVLYTNKWGMAGYISMDNVVCQETKKRIYGYNYKTNNSNKNSQQDCGNKPVFGATHMFVDNYPIRYKLNDNASLVRDGSQTVIRKANGVPDLNIKFSRFTNNTLTPDDNVFDFSNCWINGKQTHYMAPVYAKPGYEGLIGKFKCEEYMPKGTHYIQLGYEVFYADHYIKVELVFDDGTSVFTNIRGKQTSTMAKSGIKYNYGKVTVPLNKKLVEVNLYDSTYLDNSKKHALRIYSVTDYFAIDDSLISI